MKAILTIVLVSVGFLVNAQSVITEDFSDYKPAPEMVSITNHLPASSPAPIQTSVPPANVGQENPEKKSNPVKNEVKKELKFIGKLLLGIVTTAIIIKATTATNAITTD